MKTNALTRIAIAIGAVIVASITQGAVPPGPPTFTSPLNITNTFFPFQPGGTKVFIGVDSGKRATDVDVYGTDTRTFTVSGVNVACHVLREYSFERGKLVEISQNYFAQADNGAVYYFGEVVDIYEDGVVTSHEGSWLVGGPGVGDPPETGVATDPNVFMPANPELGDMFKPENLLPIVDETDEVVAVDKRVHVPAGRFDEAIIVRESSQLDPAIERKWYAPGVGVVKARGKHELLVLSASTLMQP